MLTASVLFGCGAPGSDGGPPDIALHDAAIGEAATTSDGATGTDAGPADAGTNTSALCGTWVLLQANSVAQLTSAAQTTALDAALGYADVRGFSLRVPWTAIDNNGQLDTTILDAGLAIARKHQVAYAVRFIAGHFTPAWVFAAPSNAYYFVDSTTGEKIPKPFSDAGTPGNPGFEKAYQQYVTALAAYCRANGIRVLHLPWYGKLWNELYDGPDLEMAPGFSASAWTQGHQSLIPLAMPLAGADLAIELPTSGIFTTTSAAPLVTALIAAAGSSWSQKIFVQGNGLGKYNSAPTQQAIFHGRQMYDGANTYTWSAVYSVLESAPKATYVEVYVPSFIPVSSSLQSQVTGFVSGGNCP